MFITPGQDDLTKPAFDYEARLQIPQSCISNPGGICAATIPSYIKSTLPATCHADYLDL